MKIVFPALLLGIAVSCCIFSTTVQAQTCVASTENGYDYEVAADDELTIYWTVDTANEEISFQVVYSGTAWISVGFSEDGEMIGADSVIGLPDDSTALEYKLEGQSVNDVVEATRQEISDASITQTAGTTTLVFTRPLEPSGSNKVVLSAVEGEEVIFIWAYGSNNELDLHEEQDAVTLSDIFCSLEIAGTDSSATNGDDDGASKGGTAGATCASSDPDYDFEYEVEEGEFTLFWSIVEDDTAVSVKAVYAGEGYVSVGFSDSGDMAGSDSVVGLPDDETTLEYDMPDKSTPTVQDVQEITNGTITQAEGTTTLTFVRPLNPTVESKQVLTVGSTTVWLYAWGGDNDFTEHASSGDIKFTLGSCDVSRSEAGSTKEYAHGWLMVIGWGLVFPLGVLSARFSPNFAKVGFPAHRALQTLGALCGIAGFIVAILFTEDAGLPHFEGKHGVIGLVLTAFVVIQVTAALFRPHAPKPAGIDSMGHFQSAAKPTKARFVWSLGHRVLGYVAVVVGVVQCFIGFDLLGAAKVWETIYLVLIVIIAMLFVVFQIVVCIRGGGLGRAGVVRQASGPMTNRPPSAHAGTAEQVQTYSYSKS